MSIRHYQFGYDGGNPFSHCLATADTTKGLPLVKTIKVWRRRGGSPSNELAGIQITHDNGQSSPVFGRVVFGADSFTLQDGETIKSMWQGFDPDTKRMGFIQIITNKRSWKGGPLDSPWAAQVSVHSGMLLGISGRAGTDIDKIGYYFLEDLASIKIRFDYLTLPDPGNIQLVDYNWVDGDNRGVSDRDLNIDLGYSLEVAHEFSTSEEWTEGKSTSVEVSVGFWGIGGSASTEWNESRTTGKSTSESKSKDSLLGW